MKFKTENDVARHLSKLVKQQLKEMKKNTGKKALTENLSIGGLVDMPAIGSNPFTSIYEAGMSDRNVDLDAAVTFAHVITDFIENNMDEFANMFIQTTTDDDVVYPARVEDITHMASAVAAKVVNQLKVQDLVKKIVEHTYRIALGG